MRFDAVHRAENIVLYGRHILLKWPKPWFFVIHKMMKITVKIEMNDFIIQAR